MPTAQADDFRLPTPGVRVGLSPEYNPPILKGLKVHPDNPFRFDFILDQGDEGTQAHKSTGTQEEIKSEAVKLIKYFLASLTIPEKDLWVNLSPYEKDRIIPQSFGLTEMGRDLLAEDYMLKQITASLIYPEDKVGKKFWKRIYEESAKKFGTTNIPVNTFNKVWIVPEKAVVYENAKAGTAYVVEAKLKVMLEQDYLSLSRHSEPRRGEESLKEQPLGSSLRDSSASPQNDVNALGSQIVREIVIPELTKEVNEDKNFAQLRQVYNSLILATWYKKKIKDSILEQVYADKKKIAGVGYDRSVILSEAKDLKTPLDSSASPQNDVERIYHRYLQAFKKGAYNYIKEEEDPISQQMIPRKYFSGGLSLTWKDWSMITVATFPDKAMESKNEEVIVETKIDPGLGAIASDQVPATQESDFEDVWPVVDFRRAREHLFRPTNIWQIFLGSKIESAEIFLHRGQIRFSTMNRFQEDLLVLFPQYAQEINDWLRDVKSHDYQQEDRVEIDRGLREKLSAHLKKYGDQFKAFADAFDFFVNFTFSKTNSIEEVQKYLDKVDSLANFEDPEIRKEVEQVVDELAVVYKLQARQVEEMKKMVLVVKGEDIENVSDQVKERLLGLYTLLNKFREGQPDFYLMDKLGIKAYEGQEAIFKEIIKYANLLPSLAYEVAQEYLRKTKSSAFGAVVNKGHKHVIFILPRDGRKGIISEVGHLYLAYLSDFWIEDHSVHETFDALARFALGTNVADYYSKTGEGFFNRLKTLNVEDIYKEREYQLQEMAMFKSVPTSPLRTTNKTAALMATPIFVKKILTDIMDSSEEADRILKTDHQVVSHSLGVYMARHMIEKAGTAQRAILIAEEMLKSNYKGWLNDYERFYDEFERVLLNEDLMKQVDSQLDAAMKTGDSSQLGQPSGDAAMDRRGFLLRFFGAGLAGAISGPGRLLAADLTPSLQFVRPPMKSIKEVASKYSAVAEAMKRLETYLKEATSRDEIFVSIHGQRGINSAVIEQIEAANRVLQNADVLVQPSYVGNKFFLKEHYIARRSHIFENVFYVVPLGEEIEDEKKYLNAGSIELSMEEGKNIGNISVAYFNKIELSAFMVQRWFLGKSRVDPVIEQIYKKQWPDKTEAVDDLRGALQASVAMHEYEHSRGGDEIAAMLSELILSPRPLHNLAGIWNLAHGNVDQEHNQAAKTVLERLRLTSIENSELLKMDSLKAIQTLRRAALQVYIAHRQQNFFNDVTLRAAKKLDIQVEDLLKLDVQQNREVAEKTKGVLMDIIRETNASPRVVNAIISGDFERLWKGDNVISPQGQENFITLVRKGPKEFMEIVNRLQELLISYLNKNYIDPANKLANEGRALQQGGRVPEGNKKIQEANTLVDTANAKQKEALELIGQGVLLFNALSQKLKLPQRIEFKIQRSSNEGGNLFAVVYISKQGVDSPMVSGRYFDPIMDAAMNANAQIIFSKPTGGIDLTSDKALLVQNNGQGIKFHLDPAQLAQLQNAPGFVPVIINMQPLKSLPVFLGISEKTGNSKGIG